jgi:hypothetical protein
MDPLNDTPEESFNPFITILASSPHISLVVDQNITLKAGSELFTIALGPREKGWKPFGADEAPDKRFGKDGLEKLSTSPSSSSSIPNSIHNSTQANTTSSNSRISTTAPNKAKTDIPDDGCPIFMQTGNGIRILAQVKNSSLRFKNYSRILKAYLLFRFQRLR